MVRLDNGFCASADGEFEQGNGQLPAQEAARGVSRIAGPRWNVNGDWAPTMEEIQRHLRDAHGIDPGGRDMEDLLTLHDNDHNRRGSGTNHGHKKSAKSPTKGYAKH